MTGAHATRIMTAHEHWLICPMHLLWKYDRRRCEKPECAKCCLVGRRPNDLLGSVIAIVDVDPSAGEPTEVNLPAESIVLYVLSAGQ